MESGRSMSEFVPSNNNIIVPDEATIEKIIDIYDAVGGYGTAIDFMSARNRCVWLYKIMNMCAKDIEHELRQSRINDA